MGGSLTQLIIKFLLNFSSSTLNKLILPTTFETRQLGRSQARATSNGSLGQNLFPGAGKYQSKVPSG